LGEVELKSRGDLGYPLVESGRSAKVGTARKGKMRTGSSERTNGRSPAFLTR
jgi:hypothetical protein